MNNSQLATRNSYVPTRNSQFYFFKYKLATLYLQLTTRIRNVAIHHVKTLLLILSQMIEHAYDLSKLFESEILSQ